MIRCMLESSDGSIRTGGSELLIEWQRNREGKFWLDVQEEDTSGVWAVVRAHDGCLPVVLILFVDWTGRAVGRGVLAKIDEFFLDSLESH